MIRSPKDGIDQMIEQGHAIERMLISKPPSAARDDAMTAMRRADEALTRARAAAARVDSSRLTV